MKALNIALIACLLGAGSPALAVPAAAQVSEVDAVFAQTAIMSAGSRAAKVSRLSRVPGVGVVRLDVHHVPFADDSTPDYQEFQMLAAKYNREIAKLQRALAANPVTRRALAARGVDIGRVVGVQISSNGSLRLYLL